MIVLNPLPILKKLFLKIVEIELSGILEEEEKEYFGGTYSFWERIKLKGVGSPKIVYHAGIPTFDALNDYVENDNSFVSFELMKNGLILRLNRIQRLRCVGTRLTDIEAIKLTGYKIKLKHTKWHENANKVVHMGILEILEVDGTRCSFRIFTQSFDDLLKFFKKAPFAGKFTFQLSENPTEEEEKELATFLAESGQL